MRGRELPGDGVSAKANSAPGPMFSISHPSDGTFRLEIHASPSELDPDDARRLRALLLGLARELSESALEESSAPIPRSPPSRSPESGASSRRTRIVP